MSSVTRMPLMILVVWVWVAMVQSECITNPMDAINKKAKEQYQTTDEYLKDMDKSTPHKYQNLLRVYGIYRACVESGTKRWTDNDNTGSASCPYCRTKIEEEDKITISISRDPAYRYSVVSHMTSTKCAADKLCYESQQGCFHVGVQASDEKCKKENWTDSASCVGGVNEDKYQFNSCPSCNMKRVRTEHCPYMCGYCRPRCDFFCKNFGVMDHDLCKCKCYSVYSGKACEDIDCSQHESDGLDCGDRLRKELCGKLIHNSTCPKMCGLC